jgi:hypothetical protein
MTSYTLLGLKRKVHFKYFLKKMAGNYFPKGHIFTGKFEVTSQNTTILFLGTDRRIICDKGNKSFIRRKSGKCKKT